MSKLTTTTPVTVAEQVHQVRGWILSGATEHEIAQAVATNWPGTKPRPLIIEAIKGIAKSGNGDPSIVRGWAVEATKLVYQRAMEAGDFASALRALRQVIDLTPE